MRPWLLPLALVALLASACQQMFTYSLASPLAREPQPITSLSAADAAAFADKLAADPDPALAQAAIGAFATLAEAAGASAATVADAASVAVVATGLDKALTQAVTSVDVEALVSGGGSLTDADKTTLAGIVESIAANVSADASAIFTVLADSAAADPDALAASGVGAETLVMAAAALVIKDIQDAADPAVTVEAVMKGDVTYAPSAGLSATLTKLSDGAAAINPDNQLLATLQDLLQF